MALLLLQDCLIDLSNYDKNTDIVLNETLINKIVQRGVFVPEDISSLVECIDTFFQKHKYQNETIIVSTIYYSIPFFVEEFEKKYAINVVSIFDYINDYSTTELKIIEIGDYILCKSTFNFSKNRILQQNFEIFSLEKQIQNNLTDKLIKNDRLNIFSIQRILSLNEDLKDYTADVLEYAQLCLLEGSGYDKLFKRNSVNVREFFSIIEQCIKKEMNDNEIIVSKTSLINLLTTNNLLKYENRAINIRPNTKNQFQIELFPNAKTFEEETELTFWKELNMSTIFKLLDINSNHSVLAEINSFGNGVSIKRAGFDLQFCNIKLKSDFFGNLSCRITDLNNNKISMRKIQFI